MGKIDSQTAKFLVVIIALKVAKEEYDKLAQIEVPSKVAVCSSTSNALKRMRELDFVMRSGVRKIKAGVMLVEAGLVAASWSLELRWNFGGHLIGV